MKKQVKKRMRKYTNRGFSKAQLKEILKGIKSGLSDKQVECYAKKVYQAILYERNEKGI